MIPVSEYNNQKIGVFGLGKAGDATVKSLLAGGAQLFAWDDNEKSVVSCKLQVVSENAAYNSQLITQNYSEWPWKELKALVLSPGIPLTHPKPHPVVELTKKHKVPVIGDIELLYRACPQARYVAITGTNGKSTTTTLIAHILTSAGLKVEVGGNLGMPALSLASLGQDGIYVLELSSYQLDLVRTTHFNVAVLLNVTPDHLDRHGDMQGYIKAKMHIFERQTKDDRAVIAVDDEYTKAIARELEQKELNVIKISAQRKLPGYIFVENGILRDDRNDVQIDLRNIPALTGRHNWQNAATAYAATLIAGKLPSQAIAKAMQSFPGLRHRLQLVSTINGVRFINDSKATNADATSHALAPFGMIYWILGGKPKAGGIATLGEYFPKIVHAFLIGEAAEEFARTLEGKVKYTRSGTLDVAVQQAAEMAFASLIPSPVGGRLGGGRIETPSQIMPPPQPSPYGGGGPVVLLSPACASFDQFKNFEERGDKFCGLVEKLNPAKEKHAS